MKRHLGLLAIGGFLAMAGVASAQDLVLGYSASNTGPYATQAKRNGIAIEVAVDEINSSRASDTQQRAHHNVPRCDGKNA